jgi:hypothetical protein
MIGTRIGFLFIVREAEWDFRCAKMTRWVVLLEWKRPLPQHKINIIKSIEVGFGMCDVGGGETAVLPSHYPSILTLAAQTR